MSHANRCKDKATEFRNRLSNELQGVKLPNTLIFDYPTIAAITNHVTVQLGISHAAFSQNQASVAGQLATVTGLAASLPGQRNDGFWEDLMERKDSVIEIPFSRWDLDAYYAADPDAPGKTYAKHGGFMDGTELSCYC